MTDVLQQDATTQRLATAEVVWLTTVTREGQPQSSPVWFFWDGSSFWLQSQSRAAKVRNIEGNAHVSLHLSDDGHGGDVLTIDGTATLEDAPAGLVEAALSKYADSIRIMQTTAEELTAEYPRTIRVTPTRTRAW